MLCGPNYDTLDGVVSFGIGCGRSGYPGVYTQTSHYIDWIQVDSVNFIRSLTFNCSLMQANMNGSRQLLSSVYTIVIIALLSILLGN